MSCRWGVNVKQRAARWLGTPFPGLAFTGAGGDEEEFTWQEFTRVWEHTLKDLENISVSSRCEGYRALPEFRIPKCGILVRSPGRAQIVESITPLTCGSAEPDVYTDERQKGRCYPIDSPSTLTPDAVR